ncbi:hypothetical protein BH11MYX4_BH11MYX4_50920 [soil metagenome]
MKITWRRAVALGGATLIGCGGFTLACSSEESSLLIDRPDSGGSDSATSDDDDAHWADSATEVPTPDGATPPGPTSCQPFDGGLVGDAGPYPCSKSDGGVRTLCQQYCDTITNNCRGANAQYASCGECLAMCPLLPTSDAGVAADEQSGNTKNCRRFHAQAAATDPATSCGRAGPYSAGGTCGTACQGFCSVVTKKCLADAGAAAPYATEAFCLASCVGYRANDGGSSPTCPKAGDTKQCRFYEARQASTSPAAHCPNTAAASAACDD